MAIIEPNDSDVDQPLDSDGESGHGGFRPVGVDDEGQSEESSDSDGLDSDINTAQQQLDSEVVSVLSV